MIKETKKRGTYKKKTERRKDLLNEIKIRKEALELITDQEVKKNYLDALAILEQRLSNIDNKKILHKKKTE